MIHIIKSTTSKGYYINGKYILPENWKISKHKFSDSEIKIFEDMIINNNKIDQEIELQKRLIAIYETSGNTIAVAYHKAQLNKIINEIEVKEPEIIKSNNNATTI